jgi:hypothetical protein
MWPSGRRIPAGCNSFCIRASRLSLAATGSNGSGKKGWRIGEGAADPGADIRNIRGVGHRRSLLRSVLGAQESVDIFRGIAGTTSGSSRSGTWEQLRTAAQAELQTVLGINIEKSEEIQEGDKPGCAYFTNADGFAQLRKMAVAEAQRESAQASATQKPGEKIDNPLELLKDTKDMQGTVKALGMQEPAKDGQVFSFTVDRDAGADSWAGARAAIAVAPGFAEISGVGDRAMVGTFGHLFYAMKGNTAVALTTIYVPDAQTRGADIARRILARL